MTDNGLQRFLERRLLVLMTVGPFLLLWAWATTWGEGYQRNGVVALPFMLVVTLLYVLDRRRKLDLLYQVALSTAAWGLTHDVLDLIGLPGYRSSGLATLPLDFLAGLLAAYPHRRRGTAMAGLLGLLMALHFTARDTVLMAMQSDYRIGPLYLASQAFWTFQGFAFNRLPILCLGGRLMELLRGLAPVLDRRRDGRILLLGILLGLSVGTCSSHLGTYFVNACHESGGLGLNLWRPSVRWAPMAPSRGKETM